MAPLFTLLVAIIFGLATCEVGIGLPPTPEPGAPRGRDAAVEGSVTYRERLALTPGATLIVELRDVSYADAPAPLIASRTIANPGQVPIEFRLEYDKQTSTPRGPTR